MNEDRDSDHDHGHGNWGWLGLLGLAGLAGLRKKDNTRAYTTTNTGGSGRTGV
jgi:MYXO-CTERM domain-containing protein